MTPEQIKAKLYDLHIEKETLLVSINKILKDIQRSPENIRAFEIDKEIAELKKQIESVQVPIESEVISE